MMKKFLFMTLALLLSTSLLCAGFARENLSDTWDRDAREHWHPSETDEKLNPEDHTLDDNWVCTICGAEVWLYDDGMADVYNYTPYGDITRYSSYDADGTLLDEYFYECEYDADGNLTRQMTYYQDMLVEDMLFALNANNECLPTLQTGYSDDGTWFVNEYDTYGNVVRSVSYDADDSVVFEENTEYSYNAEGMILESTIRGQFTGGGSFLTVNNQYGDTTLSEFYYADGSLEFGTRHEFEYDANGNKLSGRTYEGDILISESIYIVVEDEYDSWSYEKTYIEYMEDGTKIVYEYDENGEELSVVAYDADGHPVSESEE